MTKFSMLLGPIVALVVVSVALLVVSWLVDAVMFLTWLFKEKK